MIRPGKHTAFINILLLTLMPCQAMSAHADDALTFGVFPYLPTPKMEQIFSPIAARFSELTGRPVVLRSRPDFVRFREQVRQQTYDIIFIQPFDYIRATANSNYIPLARWGAGNDEDDQGSLRAIVVTRSDSNVESINDLDGRAVAIPHPDAAVSLLGQHALSRLHVKAEIHVAGNHLACLQQVQVKRAVACITAWPPVKLFENQHGVKLKPVYRTRKIPSAIFAVHTRVPAGQRQLLETELLSWASGSPVQKNYLSRAGWTRLHRATDKDYDVVRDIWSLIGHPE